MGKGSIVIIPPTVEHDNFIEPDSILVAMGVRRDVFDTTFRTLISKGTMLSAYYENSLYSASSDNTLIFNCGNNSFIPELLICIYKQNQQSVEKYNAVINSAFHTFLMYLIQNFEDTVEFFDNDNAYAKQMVNIEQYLRSNFATATLSSTAEHFYLTPTYLSARIKELTGFTFSQIIRNLRMECAAELLTTTELNLEEICINIGYTDVTQFIKKFKKFYGKTPNKYRKEERKNK